MKNFKKHLIFIFVVIIIILPCLIAFSSCASSDNKDKKVDSTTETTEITTEDPSASFDPELPDADFNEYEFRVLNINQDTLWWCLVNIDTAEQTGDIIQDAIYTRNRNMESKYNFKIKEFAKSETDVNNSIKKSCNAGTDDYDIVLPLTTNAPGLAVNNFLADLKKVPNINVENPWWNTSVGDYFSMNKKLFFMCSDLMFTDDDDAAVLMYNKKIATELGIENAEALYSIVEDGKWTFNKFIELCRTAKKDLNGDGNMKGDDDRFGMLTCSWFYSGMLGGFGQTTVAKDQNDLPYLSCKNDTFQNVYTSLIDFMSQRDIVAREFKDTKTMAVELYENDRALFCGEVLSSVRIFKNMTSDFGLLPLPKFDETQEKYYTYNVYSSCVAIPTTSTDLSRTGHILEALTAESRRVVVPVYYEIALNNKYLRDEGSYKMLDIILENRIYDILVTMYKWGGFDTVFESNYMNNNKDIASLIEKNEAKITAAMQKTIDSYNELE